MSLKHEVFRSYHFTMLKHQRHGELHRLNGPAYIGNRCLLWYQYDIINRLNGPAEIYRGKRSYYINGVHFNKKEYQSIIKGIRT